MYDGLYKVVGGHPQRVVTPTREEAFLDFVFDQDGRIYIVVLRDLSHTKPGHIKFGVNGKTGSYAVAPNEIPVKGTIVIDSPMASNGQCGEATFPDAGGPTCAFTTSGGTLKCK